MAMVRMQARWAALDYAEHGVVDKFAVKLS